VERKSKILRRGEGGILDGTRDLKNGCRVLNGGKEIHGSMARKSKMTLTPMPLEIARIVARQAKLRARIDVIVADLEGEK
jgi:hypothetical protein